MRHLQSARRVERVAIWTGIILMVALASLCLSGCATKRMATPHEELLGLSYQQFDQSLGSGWRSLSDHQQYREAARLIEDYLSRHPGLREDRGVNLHFHAAQLNAFAGDRSGALAHLRQARYRQEPPEWPIRWNDYVTATQAFLEHDRATLLAARERIASGPKQDGQAANLDVVDSLFAHFTESYAVAYHRPK